eukprot:SM000321S12199  [mRNA]  locus=s321:72565:74140:+ [translate_table: standard]
MDSDEISVVLARATELHSRLSDAVERVVKTEFRKQLDSSSENGDDLPAPKEAADEARSLSAIRDALEVLEEQLDQLSELQSYQRHAKDSALEELEGSRHILLQRLRAHSGQEWEVRLPRAAAVISVSQSHQQGEGLLSSVSSELTAFSSPLILAQVVHETLAFAGEPVEDKQDLPLPPYEAPLLYGEEDDLGKADRSSARQLPPGPAKALTVEHDEHKFSNGEENIVANFLKLRALGAPTEQEVIILEEALMRNLTATRRTDDEQPDTVDIEKRVALGAAAPAAPGETVEEEAPSSKPALQLGRAIGATAGGLLACMVAGGVILRGLQQRQNPLQGKQTKQPQSRHTAKELLSRRTPAMVTSSVLVHTERGPRNGSVDRAPIPDVLNGRG